MRAWWLALALPILLLAFALVVIWIPLPRPFPLAGSHARQWPAAILTGLAGGAGLLGLLLYAISVFVRAGRVLDPVLLPAGLASHGYMLFGRAYRGTLEGRPVDVYYLSRGVWPALLDVHVGARLETRAAVGRSRPLLDCRDCPLVDWPGLSGLRVYAQDGARIAPRLAAPASQAALERLVLDQAISGFREIYFQPGRIWLRAHPTRMAPPQFQRWLDDLLTLAQAVEVSSFTAAPAADRAGVPPPPRSA